MPPEGAGAGVGSGGLYAGSVRQNNYTVITRVPSVLKYYHSIVQIALITSI